MTRRTTTRTLLVLTGVLASAPIGAQYTERTILTLDGARQAITAAVTGLHRIRLLVPGIRP